MSITLTPDAKSHFINLIAAYKNEARTKQKLNIRIKAISAGTNKASIDLSYCPEGEQGLADLKLDQGDFILYIAQDSIFALTDAVIDHKYSYNENSKKLSGSGKLHINAPFLKEVNNSASLLNLDLFNKIKNFLHEKVNPTLARHNGMVQLLAVSADGKEVTLQFAGGCKGCSIVNITLKNVIEKSLKAEFPEITLIKDTTNHANK